MKTCLYELFVKEVKANY